MGSAVKVMMPSHARKDNAAVPPLSKMRTQLSNAMPPMPPRLRMEPLSPVTKSPWKKDLPPLPSPPLLSSPLPISWPEQMNEEEIFSLFVFDIIIPNLTINKLKLFEEVQFT